jgi:hypothetical protein
MFVTRRRHARTGRWEARWRGYFPAGVAEGRPAHGWLYGAGSLAFSRLDRGSPPKNRKKIKDINVIWRNGSKPESKRCIRRARMRECRFPSASLVR